MFLGVDLGTSSVKVVLQDQAGLVVADASAPLTVSRPEPLWSEQDPAEWVSAAEAAVKGLPAKLRQGVEAVGLSGQMHGPTLLDADGRVLRPAILWNDGRSHRECHELETREPRLRDITGNKAMAGFTAPKLLWTRKHEPETFSKIAKVLLPKDYLRLAWTGDYATDVSDASGTLWLDTQHRQWSEDALAASDMTPAHMPTLHEGTAFTGSIRASTSARLGLPPVPVVAGGGDQAAGAVGVGVTRPGEASLSLGTSGVLFIVSDAFKPNPDEAAHAFCHALPDRWHQMAVLLSAASAVDAAARMAGYPTAAEAYAAAEAHGQSDGVMFLPYLSGERTPHDDPFARGAFFGLSANTRPSSLVHAALEGVAFAFVDGMDALSRAGGIANDITVIGGGARSAYWGKIISSALGCPLVYREGAETGPAEGAAKLARIALTGEDAMHVFAPAPVRAVIEPNAERHEFYGSKIKIWRELYQRTKALSREETAHG
ncbi:MAG: xylulokinase [Pseudomonadota bacterium]